MTRQERQRGRSLTAYAQVHSRGPLSRTCPKCQAKPSHSCARWAKDASGQPYLAARLKTFHAERKIKP